MTVCRLLAPTVSAAPPSTGLVIRLRMDGAQRSVAVDIDTANPVEAPVAAKDRQPLVIHQSYGPGLLALRNLPPSEVIVLFTPVVVPDGFTMNRLPIDPFETLGLHVAHHHRRVRHVPYVAKVGMTETHRAWVQEAAAIVAVTCPSTSSHQKIGHSVEPPNRLEATLAPCTSFVDSVAIALKQVGNRADSVPLIKLDFSPWDQGDSSWPVGDCTVVRCGPYNHALAHRAARFLFGP